MGRVRRVDRGEESFTLAIEADKVLDGTKLGDSISVDGVCLTVTALSDSHFEVGLAPETLSRTTLGELETGGGVNLERSLTPTTRMGGHFVQGHIDGTAKIVSKERDDDSVRMEFEFDPSLLRYVVNKGFIAVDGISLTVIDARESSFTLMLVDYTLSHVTLGKKEVGDRVNVEVDILAKYVEKVARPVSGPVTLDPYAAVTEY